MEQEQILVRKRKGVEIAKTSRILRTAKGWVVPSQSGSGAYLVTKNKFETKCECPDYELRKVKCKHVWAVEITVTATMNKEGGKTVTKTVKVSYPQNWAAYDLSQTKQKEIFMQLLADLTKGIPQPAYAFGRPKLPIGDMVFASALKVFTTFSLRRFLTDARIAKDKGYVDSVPCFASVGHFLQNPEITPVLKDLIKVSSLPLRTVETTFAIDSSGFSTSRFDRWYDFKYGREAKNRIWVKAHLMVGTKTNIVTGVEITKCYGSDTADSPQLPNLVSQTTDNFTMTEVSADKAYSSRNNLAVIEEAGAVPYIPFKEGSTDKPKTVAIWKKMWHYFQYNKEQFFEHYHKRSNIESTNHMIKSKFGDAVRSKTWVAQMNETLCKILCHNICCVIQEMHELGITPNFCVESQTPVYKGGEIKD